MFVYLPVLVGVSLISSLTSCLCFCLCVCIYVSLHFSVSDFSGVLLLVCLCIFCIFVCPCMRVGTCVWISLSE